jgi:hypothetical protein
MAVAAGGRRQRGAVVHGFNWVAGKVPEKGIEQDWDGGGGGGRVESSDEMRRKRKGAATQ